MTPSSRAFAVSSAELNRWDPSSFHMIQWHWPSEVMSPLGSCLSRRKERVNPSEHSFADLQPITVHANGMISPREVDTSRPYTMDLFFARPGDFVVAKIDLKHGAVGILPNWSQAVVTNHFAVYEPKLDRVVPEYLRLLIQTETFKSHLWRNKVGAEGRKEVKLDFFEQQLIPLPPRPVQQAIVDVWQAAQSLVDKSNDGAAQIVVALDSELRRIYHEQCGSDVLRSRLFVVGSDDLSSWDVKSGKAAAFRRACPDFMPMGDFIEEATESVDPAKKPDHMWPVYGVSNKNGVFLSAHQAGRDFNRPYKRIRADWFFHNPTRCSVGSLGIVPQVPDDAITSSEYQVWRLKSSAPKPLLTDYVALLIRTSFFLELIQFNRVGAVKQRMYVSNLCDIRIPYLDPQEQKRFSKARAKALRDIDAAQLRLREATSAVEAMILGTAPIPEPRVRSAGTPSGTEESATYS